MPIWENIHCHVYSTHKWGKYSINYIFKKAIHSFSFGQELIVLIPDKGMLTKQLAILKHLYLNIFFVFSCIPCWLKALGILR